MTLTDPRGPPENLFDLGPLLAASGGNPTSMPTGPWLRAPDGRPSAAGLGVLLDDVLGQAVLTSRPDGLWSVTTDLNIDVTAPLPADGQRVSATAGPALLDDAGGLARGGDRGAAGPWLPAALARGACLSVLLGVVVPDNGRVYLPLRADLGNPQGVVHGGILLSLAVMSAEQVLRPGSQLEIASVRVAYLRPAAGELSFVPVTVHRGRSFGVVRVDVSNAAGALCTSATVTVRSATGPGASPVTEERKQRVGDAGRS